MVELVCVDRRHLDQFWPHVEPLLRAATERCGDWSIEQVKAEIERDALLWMTFDGTIKAAAVTRLLRTEDGLTCEALACGGADDDWPSRFSEIEEYARAEGCTRCRISGRPGWAKVFREYRLELVVLEKRLN